MDILISNLLSKSILDFGSGQTENTQIRVFAYFPFYHFPKSKIYSESRFEIRMSIFLFYIFFKEFQPIFKKVKKLISHCILKL